MPYIAALAQWLHLHEQMDLRHSCAGVGISIDLHDEKQKLIISIRVDTTPVTTKDFRSLGVRVGTVNLPPRRLAFLLLVVRSTQQPRREDAFRDEWQLRS
jgi:hypothetical protein